MHIWMKADQGHGQHMDVTEIIGHWWPQQIIRGHVACATLEGVCEDIRLKALGYLNKGLAPTLEEAKTSKRAPPF